MVEALPLISPVLRITGKLVPWLIRWYYTEAKLNERLVFDVSASGDWGTYQYHTQEGWCNLKVTNLSPFDITLDRTEVVVSAGGSFAFFGVLPKIIKAGCTETIQYTGHSPMLEQTAKVLKQSDSAMVRVEAYVICSVRSFVIRKYIKDLKNLRVNGP